MDTTEIRRKTFTGRVKDWPTAKAKIWESQEKMRKCTEAIIQDSENLLKHNVLSIERRMPEVHELCSQRQCRLKLVFVETEASVLKAQMNFIQITRGDFGRTVENLYENGLLRRSDKSTLDQKLKEVDQSFQTDIQSMGYEDAIKFGKAAGVLLGTLGTAASVTMFTHVCVTSTSLGALLSGSGTIAGLSTGACLGLATGGVLIAVGAVGLLIYGGVSALAKDGDNHSREITNALEEGMADIMKAHKACAEHVKKLEAISTKLKSLRVIPKD